MKGLILMVLILGGLSGCASNHTRLIPYDNTKNKALNIALAADMIDEPTAEKIKAAYDQQKMKKMANETHGGIVNTSNVVLAASSGYQALKYGVKSLDPTSIVSSMLLTSMNTSWSPLRDSHFLVWMPVGMAKDGGDAAKKIAGILSGVFRKVLLQEGFIFDSDKPNVQVSPHLFNDNFQDSFSIRCELCPGQHAVLHGSVYAPEGEVFDETPEWIHVGASYYWSFRNRSNDSSPVVGVGLWAIDSRKEKPTAINVGILGVNYKRIYSAMSKKLPDWIYIYIASSDGQEPFFLNQGKVYKFSD